MIFTLVCAEDVRILRCEDRIVSLDARIETKDTWRKVLQRTKNCFVVYLNHFGDYGGVDCGERIQGMRCKVPN